MTLNFISKPAKTTVGLFVRVPGRIGSDMKRFFCSHSRLLSPWRMPILSCELRFRHGHGLLDL